MPLIATRGAASVQGFGEFAQTSAPVYIEDVFSTYLYTGNSSTQTITNGIDLSGKGGLVWLKPRNAVGAHSLMDSSRSNFDASLSTNTTAAEVAVGRIDPTSSGFTLLTAGYNGSGDTFASWTFRKQPKFFDIVTYTGDGTNNRAIPHNLGSTPGCIIVKSISLGLGWPTYHRGMATSNPESWEMYLNTTAARTVNGTWGGAPTSTNFYVNNLAAVNQGGDSYVAYLFAHDAGGFGLTGLDNVISCGSFTASGGIASVTLGYEPQWLLIKSSNGVDDWQLFDTMRGMTTQPTYAALLRANTSGAEATGGGSGAYVTPTATGFDFNYGSTATYIYIACRRGPMKVPTTGTSVFSPVALTPTSSQTVTTGFPVDLTINDPRSSLGGGFPLAIDRLRGTSSSSVRWLTTSDTSAETAYSGFGFNYANNTGFVDTLSNQIGNTVASIYWNFRRAPSFFDEVCWDGNSSGNRALTHNLGIAPEMMIMKSRNTAGTNWQWWVFHKDISNTPYPTNMTLNSNEAAYVWSSTINTPTTTTFTVGSSFGNTTGNNFVAYLFATCAGVSKVGSYTGTGTTQTINCGFTAGSRFIMIKRTDSTGDWYVWDSARGIVAGNDPYLLLNSTAAEVTNTDYVDTANSGFEISSTAPAAINANGGTFIFLAIA